MPMQQVERSDAISKSEFHKRLRAWLALDESCIGPEDIDGRTSWVHVRDRSAIFGLHADTKKEAVDQYLRSVALHGDDLDWEIVPSQRGNMTAVVFGPERLRHKSFYLYVTGGAV